MAVTNEGARAHRVPLLILGMLVPWRVAAGNLVAKQSSQPPMVVYPSPKPACSRSLCLPTAVPISLPNSTRQTHHPQANDRRIPIPHVSVHVAMGLGSGTGGINAWAQALIRSGSGIEMGTQLIKRLGG